MGHGTSLEGRMSIIALSESGLTDAQVGRHLGVSPRTVRKWRRRHALQGRAALASAMGRPSCGALHAHPRVREAVLTWRLDHPGWGPKTLRAELARDPRFATHSVPSRSTLARLLHEQGLSRVYQRHSSLPAVARSFPGAAHEEWEMDARGYELLPNVGVVSLIQVNDRYSRARLLSYPCYLGERRAERHATTQDYQLVLRLAFEDWGLPDRLSVDHESVFFDNDTRSPFPTRFHLWLLALGVDLVFSRIHRPTDHALTERSHQLWAAQVLRGVVFPTRQALYGALRERRDFLNWNLPCISLGDKPPLVVHPEATRPRRGYQAGWETELLDLSRIYAYLAQCRWFRRVSSADTVALGGQVYYVGKPSWARQQVEISFDPEDQHFVARSEDSLTQRRFPARRLSKAELMGELDTIFSTPGYQLRIPFREADWRLARLCETLAA